MQQPRDISGRFGTNKQTAQACRTQAEFRDAFLALSSEKTIKALHNWLMEIASDPKHPQRYKAIVELLDRLTGSDAVISLPETPIFTPLQEDDE